MVRNMIERNMIEVSIALVGFSRVESDVVIWSLEGVCPTKNMVPLNAAHSGYFPAIFLGPYSRQLPG